MDPKEVDLHVQKHGITLHQLRAVIPAHCFVPQETRAWLALFRVLFFAGLLIFAIHKIGPSPDLWGWLALCLIWPLYAAVLVGLFVLGHDCGHGSFSKSRRTNHALGYLLMTPLLNGFHTWKLTHNHHHAHTQLRGQEVDWASFLRTESELSQASWSKDFMVRLGYAIPFGLFIWIGWNTVRRALKVREQLGERAFLRERGQLLISNAIMLLFVSLMVLCFYRYGSLWDFARFHGIPAYLAGVLGGFIIAAGHASESSLIFSASGWTSARGQLSSTYNVRFPRVFEWLICDINIHIPHHVSVRIPWYHLREAGDAIQKAYPALYQEYPFTWSSILWCKDTPVLIPEEGYFTLAPRAREARG